MEWVETTGRTLEEAKDAALDQLGVDEPDAEFEVLAEPRPGLFGRLRGEARVRARVRPARPRPKADRRDRRQRRGREGRSGEGGRKQQPTAAGQPTPERRGARPEREEERAPATGADASGPARRRRRPRSDDTGDATPATREGESMEESVTVARQAEVIQEFMTGLVDAFGLDADVTTTDIDEETVEVRVEGDDLGLLIGPKGQTLAAVQDLGRTVVQRKETGHHEGRVRLDVAGYRQRRREALERFAGQVAADVVASGVQRALEPMNAADRKVVHDAVNEIDGVRTTSEGVEPNRRVVILPAAGEG